MNEVIKQRIANVVEQSVTQAVVSRVTPDNASKIEAARREERQAKANALARATARKHNAAEPTDGESKAAIEELIAEEDCGVCESILRALAEMPEPKRTKGVAEYGRFRDAIDTSEDAAEEVLEDSDVLVEALNNVQQVPT